MDAPHIFDQLNDAQRKAVAAPAAPLLVLAGAGSGKTRVLTHRVAWLVQGLNASPFSILAVTFTNKAAREMRGRIEQLLQMPCGGLWIGTFHGLGHRLLRRHHEEAGLAQNFEILDSEDQQRLVKRVLRDLDLDPEEWKPRKLQWMINLHKEEARRAQDLPRGDDPQQRTLFRVYAAYEEFCQRLGVVDFAEILLRTLELFRDNESLRAHYQQRFEHVLVDEFQDTNKIQYQWLRLLTDKSKNMFAVGDDDQSIYAWRGARVENLLNFEKHFPGAEIVRLEQNYRSSGNILHAANAIIENNSGRLGKELWTEESPGALIRAYAARDDADEARFVVEKIERAVEGGMRRDQTAVLYRSNAQSRVFEEELLSRGVPYRVYGGLRFFERAEVKDALAYMRLISNRDADAAFERVVNQPTRGIGDRTREVLREVARNRQMSLWRAAQVAIGEHLVTPRAAASLGEFLQLIDSLGEVCADVELGEIAEHVLAQTGLLAHFKKDKDERSQTRVENLEEFINAARNFTRDEDDEADALSQFLTNAALEAGDGQAEAWEDCVQLMSLHSAKGLEFPLVFLCGMEEGLFPHQRALEEAGRLEEERRLCYVGMTRAMQSLYVCYAEVRRLYGREHYAQASRFLTEIPSKYVETIGATRAAFATATNHARGNANGLMPGIHVRHKKFGDGTVLDMEGRGEHARVQVHFADAGSKWLVLSHANLERV